MVFDLSRDIHDEDSLDEPTETKHEQEEDNKIPVDLDEEPSQNATKNAAKRGKQKSYKEPASASTSDLQPSPAVSPAPIKLLSNGSIPKASGKPMMLSMDKKTKRKIMKPRGRPKQKATVAVYQSQIKDNNAGIKLCIKKSSDSEIKTASKAKQVRKRSRKTKRDSDSENSEISGKRKRKDGKGKSNNNLSEQQLEDIRQIQSPFANRLPEHVLHKVSLKSPYKITEFSDIKQLL